MTLYRVYEDVEELDARTVTCAVVEAIEDHKESTHLIPLTMEVIRFEPMAVDMTFPDGELIDVLNDLFSEEFGDPDGTPRMSETDRNALMKFEKEFCEYYRQCYNNYWHEPKETINVNVFETLLCNDPDYVAELVEWWWWQWMFETDYHGKLDS